MKAKKQRVSLNTSLVKLSSSKKHLGLSFASKFSFDKHINDKIDKNYIDVGLLR